MAHGGGDQFATGRVSGQRPSEMGGMDPSLLIRMTPEASMQNARTPLRPGASGTAT
jgi:hypothetical protein